MHINTDLAQLAVHAQHVDAGAHRPFDVDLFRFHRMLLHKTAHARHDTACADRLAEELVEQTGYCTRSGTGSWMRRCAASV